MSPEERNLRKLKSSTESSTINAMNLQHNIAEDNLTRQLEEDGWCADLWEGLKWVATAGTSDNLDENVKKALNEYSGYIDDLNAAYKKGGISAFKTKFKAIFGIEYDQKLASAYAVKMDNYTKAEGLTKLKNTLHDNIGGFGTSWCSYSQLESGYLALLKKTNPSENSKQKLEEMLKSYMEERGVKYTKEYSDNKFRCLRQMTDETLDGFQKEIDRYSNGKSLEQLQEDLTTQGGSLFGTKHDVIDRVNKYIISQQKGDVIISTSAKVAAMVVLGVVSGGVASAAVGTFTTSLAIDASNQATGKGLNAELFFEDMKSATIDAAFAGTATSVRNTIKGVKTLNELGKSTAIVVGDTAIGTGSAAFKGNLTKENFGYYLAFSILAQAGSSRIGKGKISLNNKEVKLNYDRAFRRTIKGADKERKANNKNFDKNNNYTTNKLNQQYGPQQLRDLLATVTNLGDLNALKRNISNMKDVIPNKTEICNLIDERVNELIINPHLITTASKKIPEEIRENAVAALNQPAKHLRQDQIDNITQYITSISEPANLYQTIAQLQQHGIDLNDKNPLRDVLDDKFAELNQMPAYKVDQDFILYAKKSDSPNPNNKTSTEKNNLEIPTLNNYLTINYNPDSAVKIQLDQTAFNKIKNELYSLVANIKNNNDVTNLLVQIQTIGSESQREELSAIINNAAKMNGLLV